jgi:hypothetical protein
MAKIENTTVYPTVTPASEDLLIGTDVSDNNKTVTFLVSSVSGAGGVAQGLQSVLDTGNTATQNISLTGNITVVGTITPTTLTASNGVGAAGQILSSTGTGLQWIASPSVSIGTLEQVLTAGNSTTLDINSTGSINMSGAAKVLALSGGTDMTLAVGSTLTTSDAINLGTTLNFGATTTLNDYSGATGSAGQILTINAAGTGVEWGTLPTASIPTLQQVLTAGNTATGVGISFVGASAITFDSTANITSAGTNLWSGNNTFSATGTTTSTAGIALTGTLYDGASIGTAGQVLTSTGSGVAWASTAGVSSVTAQTPATSSGTPLTISPTSGAVQVTSNAYAGGSNVGHVPAGGTAGTFLQGDGTWAGNGGGFAQTYTFCNDGVDMAQNVYFSFLGIDGTDFSSKATSSTNSLSTTSPTAGTYSDIDYFAGIIMANGQAGSCASSIDVPTVCSVDFSVITDSAITFELSLWKVQENVNAPAVLVAQSVLIPSALNTLASSSATLTGANTTLDAGYGLFFTVRQTVALSVVGPKYQGRVNIKFSQS